MKSEHLQAVHALAGIGITWQQILAWIQQYGLSAVLTVLEVLLPILLGSSKLTTTEIIAYAIACFQAISAGQPLPPPPVGAVP